MNQVVTLATYSSQHRILSRKRQQHVKGFAAQREIRAIVQSWIPRFKLLTGPKR